MMVLLKPRRQGYGYGDVSLVNKDGSAQRRSGAGTGRAPKSGQEPDARRVRGSSRVATGKHAVRLLNQAGHDEPLGAQLFPGVCESTMKPSGRR